MSAVIALLVLGVAVVGVRQKSHPVADQDTPETGAFTALHRAAEKGFLNSVKVQVQRGDDLNVTDERGMTPLHYAAGEGWHSIVLLLLEGGASVNVQEERGWTPLHMTAAMGRAELSQLLLEEGADPDASDELGLTPLHHAATEGCEEVIRILLAHGARVNAKDRRGWTPLHHAVYAGYPGVSELLVASGADASINNNQGRTPLEQAGVRDQDTLLASPPPEGSTSEGPGKGPVPSRDVPPNVLFIVVDALRPDRLRCYGYERPTSPRLDVLAAEGVLFTDVMAQGAETSTATPSLLTGQRQGGLGTVAVKWEQTIHHWEPGRDSQTLAELLRDGGYATGAVSANPVLDPQTGLHRGFDYFDLAPAQGPVWVKDSGVDVNRAAFRWLEQQASSRKPFFLYLHYIGPHLYYSPPGEFCVFGRPTFTERDMDLNRRVFDSTWQSDCEVTDETLSAQGLSRRDLQRLNDLYDDEVLYADHNLGQLFDRLKELGVYDSTIIIVTADHGEAFLEHNTLKHSVTLYQELIRIPLVIRGLGIPGGRTVEELVEAVDIAPTVLEATGIPLRTHMSGRSFYQTLAHRTRFTKDLGLSEISTTETFALRRGSLKLISSPRGVELYDLSRDPGETQNLAPSREKDVMTMQTILAELLQERAQAVETTEKPTESQLRAMRALGYLK